MLVGGITIAERNCHTGPYSFKGVRLWAHPTPVKNRGTPSGKANVQFDRAFRRLADRTVFASVDVRSDPLGRRH